MKKQEYTQCVLSQKLGVRQSQVSNWLNGKSYPNYFSIQKLLIWVKITSDILLGGIKVA
jgi:transcriptional regulator with XRE-family HTH domain